MTGCTFTCEENNVALAPPLRWMQPWRELKREDFKNGDVRWFIDGKLNVCDNCADGVEH